MDSHVPLILNSNDYEQHRWEELNQQHWVLSTTFLDNNFSKLLSQVQQSAQDFEKGCYFGIVHGEDEEDGDDGDDDKTTDNMTKHRLTCRGCADCSGPDRDAWGNAYNGTDPFMVCFCPPPPPAPHYEDYKYLKFILSALFLPFDNTLGTAYYPRVVLSLTNDMDKQQQSQTTTTTTTTTTRPI